MELKTAIEILDYHQEWRLGKRDDMIHDPKKLTEALDLVLIQVKKNLMDGVGETFYCQNKNTSTSKCKIQCVDCYCIEDNGLQ